MCMYIHLYTYIYIYIYASRRRKHLITRRDFASFFRALFFNCALALPNECFSAALRLPMEKYSPCMRERVCVCVYVSTGPHLSLVFDLSLSPSGKGRGLPFQKVCSRVCASDKWDADVDAEFLRNDHSIQLPNKVSISGRMDVCVCMCVWHCVIGGPTMALLYRAGAEMPGQLKCASF